MLYIFTDEYGSPTYKNLHKDPNKAFFLSAIVIEPKEYPLVDREIKAFEFRWFNTQKVFLRFRLISNRESICSFLSEKHWKKGFTMTFTRRLKDANLGRLECISRKKKMQQQYSYPVHPYLSSIQLICERLIWNDEKDFRWCFESRGTREDKVYEEGLRRQEKYGYIDPALPMYLSNELKKLNISAVFRTKKHFVSGLDIADTAAYCMGSIIRKWELGVSDFWPFSERIARLLFGRIFHERAIVILP